MIGASVTSPFFGSSLNKGVQILSGHCQGLKLLGTPGTSFLQSKIEEAMHSLPGLQFDNVSSPGFVYHVRTQFIRRNEFHRICGKSRSDGQEKSEEEINFHWMRRQCFGPKMKPGSKNAKEIRVDATSGQILAVQTERPEDQAEEPPKTH